MCAQFPFDGAETNCATANPCSGTDDDGEYALGIGACGKGFLPHRCACGGGIKYLVDDVHLPKLGGIPLRVARHCLKRNPLRGLGACR